jgi:hypothetical protein
VSMTGSYPKAEILRVRSAPAALDRRREAVDGRRDARVWRYGQPGGRFAQPALHMAAAGRTRRADGDAGRGRSRSRFGVPRPAGTNPRVTTASRTLENEILREALDIAATE